MRTGFLATVAVVAAAVFSSAASAEVITPEVVKPEVVTPHAVTAPPQPSTPTADTPGPEASPTPQAAPAAATSEESAAGDDPAAKDPSPRDLPVGDRGRLNNPLGPYPLNVSVANYNNALTLIYAIAGMFGPSSQQAMLERSINVVRNTNILLGGEGGRPQTPDASTPPADTPRTFDEGNSAPDGGGAGTQGGGGSKSIDDEPPKSEE